MGRRQGLATVLFGIAIVGIAVWAVAKVTEDDEVGRVFDASAAVDDGCQSLDIRVDGFFFMTDGGLPIEWRGTTVQGTVEVTEDDGADGLVGIFTSADGRTIRVHGGEEGGDFFFNAPCALW